MFGKFFKNRQDMERSHINQPIYITDLILKPPSEFSYGEADTHINKYYYYNDETEDIRLRDHISFLFDLINADHRAHYCSSKEDGTYTLNPDKKNHITRLLTHEFFFYTSKPLSTEVATDLIKDISIMAEELEPNVHILLSSFAIQEKNGAILNMAFFIQGGQPPIIHNLVKQTAHEIDIDYDKTVTLFSQQKRNSYPTSHPEYIIDDAGLMISMASIFEITTEGGARYLQGVDICCDHMTGHSKNLLLNHLSDKKCSFGVLSDRVEQCITSNSIHLKEEHVYADYVVHIDPMIEIDRDKPSTPGEKILADNMKRHPLLMNYPDMQLIDTKTGYKLIDPIFGSDCIIEILSERSAAQYKSDIQKIVNRHNQQICEEVIKDEQVSVEFIR